MAFRPVFGRTKIVATLGPASSSRESLRQLIQAGVDVFRLNFSHGEYDRHSENVKLVRAVAEQEGQHVALLQDLCGPKMRTGKLENGKPILLETGERVVVTPGTFVGGGSRDQKRLSCTYDGLPLDVNKGNRILLSDGLIGLECMDVQGSDVVCEVVNGGLLKESQGINLPGVLVSAPCLTPKDHRDLEFGLKHGVDFVAVSFVRQASDITYAQNLIRTLGKKTPVVPKIERPEAVECIDDIVKVTDGGVMIARGDLGVEIDPADVPIMQKRIVQSARNEGLPSIVATQMLESMIQNPRPTRAEASDVHNAIMDGADAIMLSGETAVGKFPVEAVEFMSRIIAKTEDAGLRGLHDSTFVDHTHGTLSEDAICSAVVSSAKSQDVKAIMAFTYSGAISRSISQYRPQVPIVVLSPSEAVCRRSNLLYGVMPVTVGVCSNIDELEATARRVCLEMNIAAAGDHVIMTGSHPLSQRSGSTNFMQVVKI